MNDTEVSDQNIRTSFGNGDDFVKIYTDELQKNDSEMLLERSQQRTGAITSALPDITAQKTLKEGREKVKIELSSDQLSFVPVITADCDAQENQQQVSLKYDCVSVPL